MGNLTLRIFGVVEAATDPVVTVGSELDNAGELQSRSVNRCLCLLKVMTTIETNLETTRDVGSG